VSSAPKLEPPTLNCTPATPTLSEAEADTVMVPETVAPLLGEDMLTVGGVVSPEGGGEMNAPYSHLFTTPYSGSPKVTLSHITPSVKVL
jgi:hypothetical protein